MRKHVTNEEKRRRNEEEQEIKHRRSDCSKQKHIILQTFRIWFGNTETKKKIKKKEEKNSEIKNKREKKR